MAYKKDYFVNRGQCVISRKILKYAISKGKELINNSESSEAKKKNIVEMLVAVYLIVYYAVFHEDDIDFVARLTDDYKEIYFFHKMDIDDKAEQYDGRASGGRNGGAPVGNRNAAKYKNTEKDTKTPESHNSVVENDDMQITQNMYGDFV